MGGRGNVVTYCNIKSNDAWHAAGFFSWLVAAQDLHSFISVM